MLDVDDGRSESGVPQDWMSLGKIDKFQVLEAMCHLHYCVVAYSLDTIQEALKSIGRNKPINNEIQRE